MFDRQRIIVAGADSVAMAFAVMTLRHDGHCVTQAEDILLAPSDLALGECHLLITGSGIMGAARTALIDGLRERLPALAVLCLAHAPGEGPGSHPGVSSLREPFTAEELRAAVRPLLPQLRVGSVLAQPAPPAPAPVALADGGR